MPKQNHHSPKVKGLVLGLLEVKLKYWMLDTVLKKKIRLAVASACRIPHVHF